LGKVCHDLIKNSQGKTEIQAKSAWKSRTCLSKEWEGQRAQRDRNIFVLKQKCGKMNEPDMYKPRQRTVDIFLEEHMF
jgi:hypothetical protein